MDRYVFRGAESSVGIDFKLILHTFIARQFVKLDKTVLGNAISRRSTRLSMSLTQKVSNAQRLLRSLPTVKADRTLFFE